MDFNVTVLGSSITFFFFLHKRVYRYPTGYVCNGAGVTLILTSTGVRNRSRERDVFTVVVIDSGH